MLSQVVATMMIAVQLMNCGGQAHLSITGEEGCFLSWISVATQGPMMMMETPRRRDYLPPWPGAVVRGRG